MEPDAVRRFRAGDESAVRELVRRHAGAVATVARSILGSSDLVADVVQQTFVKAWRAAGSLEEGRAIEPWLYTIARRTAIDMVRTERRPTIGGHAPERDVAVDDVTFERTVQIHDVRAALDALPPDERDVMKMAYLLGMSLPEIADSLGIPVGTVKSRTARARGRLAATLARYAPDANHSGRESVQGVENLR